jgi:hypothetical protein
MPRSTPDIASADVPQAPNLARIRAVITALADGESDLDAVAEQTDISARHVGYAVRAAQALDLLDRDRAPTARGRALLETEQESVAERAAFRQAISAKPPTKKTLGARIEKLSGLSKATAEHRAGDLLAWREQVLEEDG